MPELANRLKTVKVSASAAMTDKARDLRAAGVKIVSLSSGEPDFPTPPHAIEAAHRAALSGDTKYPAQPGTVALRTAVQRKFKRENNLDYALDEILVANGGKQIIFNALLATCNPGDEVVIPAPGWITYADIVRFAEATPVAPLTTAACVVQFVAAGPVINSLKPHALPLSEGSIWVAE